MNSGTNKEILRHLRLVHFWLAAACIGLLITVQGDTTSMASKAYDQHVLLEARWQTLCKVVEDSSIQDLLEAELYSPTSSGPYLFSKYAMYPYNGTFPWKVLSPMYLEREDGKHLSLPLFTDALSEFRNSWNSLLKERIRYVTEIKGDSIYLTEQDMTTLEESDWTINEDSIIKRELFEDANNSLPIKKGNHLRNVRLIERDSQNGTVGHSLLTMLVGTTSFGFSLMPIDTHTFMVPVETKLRTLNVLKELSGVADTEAPLVPFSQAFPELHIVTKNYADIPLDKIRRILESEKRRQGKQFEALGVKVPSSLAAAWGSPIVLLIHAYFLLHLLAFGTVNSSTPRNIEVPWIGIYKQPLAALLVLASVCILPTATLLIVAAQNVLSAKTLGWWELYAPIVCTVLSIPIAIKIFNHLPYNWLKQIKPNPGLSGFLQNSTKWIATIIIVIVVMIAISR